MQIRLDICSTIVLMAVRSTNRYIFHILILHELQNTPCFNFRGVEIVKIGSESNNSLNFSSASVNKTNKLLYHTSTAWALALAVAIRVLDSPDAVLVL